MVDLNAVSIDKKGGLLDRLGMITDHRMRRGIRHIQFSILAIAIDGKTLRGSKGSKDKGVHLLASFLQKEGVVISKARSKR